VAAAFEPLDDWPQDERMRRRRAVDPNPQTAVGDSCG
jgi:hypothetical protein